MRPSADPIPNGAGAPLPGPPAFAEGIADYVALVRGQPAAGDMVAMRLLGDLTSERFAAGLSTKVRRFDTAIAADGREIGLRIYDPGGQGLRPAICYFHGGGFAFGSVESFDLIGATLAEATGAIVASVEYRRLPDTDYVGAQSDCDLAFAWLARQAGTLGVDPARLMVAGDSAGALLAFACAANARDGGGVRPVGQILFYGTFAMDPERADYRNAGDPLLSEERVRGYIALFGKCGGLQDRPAPIDRSDLAELPPTHIVAAEHDPLCGEASALAARLIDAGVSVSLQVAPGMIHGFLRAAGVSAAARNELAKAAAAIRPWLSPSKQ